MNLAATLPALLQARGWTQERLADASGIRRTDINRIARGKVMVGRARLERIADALEVSVLELAPAEEPDARGLLLLDRLAALEVQVATDVVKLRRDLDAAKRRIQALEQQSPLEVQPARRPKKNP